MGQNKKMITLALIMIFLLAPFNQSSYGEISSFKDVPQGHWAEADINQLRALHITEGIGNSEFGLGRTISRAEFVTFVVRISDWELLTTRNSNIPDNQDVNAWYFSSVETALSKGVITNSQNFRPQAAITREEMAIMMVRALGYDALALQLNNQGSVFTDVSTHIGYTNLLSSFDIIKGSGNNLYLPYTTATREEAAALLIRMYTTLHEGTINNLHAFYSSGSYSQVGILGNLSSISFDWLSISYDQNELKLNLSLPSGYEEPLNTVRAGEIPGNLMLLVDSKEQITLESGSTTSMLNYILTNENVQKKLIDDIVGYLKGSVTFDGITIDFESMRGNDTATLFNSFLTRLETELTLYDKKLIVTVHPKTYYDGYDYKTIGEIADGVILMAHDYETKKLTPSDMLNGYTNTPLTPITNVYEALEAITDPITGVQDRNKIYLQISFSSAQWQLIEEEVINASPYMPTYDMIEKRLVQEGVEIHYDALSQNPYATYYNATTNTNNKIWYEDSRSVQAKIKLAQMFGIHNISLWRLGNIPNYPEDASIYLNVWEIIQSQMTPLLE